MPAANISALGATRKMLGFSRRTLEFEHATVADLLRSLETSDGRSLYDNLVCGGKLLGNYAIVVNGTSLNSEQLNTPLQGGEEVVAMAILRHLHGG
jgi:hypothetical protein